MIKRAYNSIEAIYKEILSENYWQLEFESMKAADPYTCKELPRAGLPRDAMKIFTLENLVNRVKELKTFRKEIQKLLELVQQRELVLK